MILVRIFDFHDDFYVDSVGWGKIMGREDDREDEDERFLNIATTSSMEKASHYFKKTKKRCEHLENTKKGGDGRIDGSTIS